jgi:hypothetical protein
MRCRSIATFPRGGAVPQLTYWQLPTHLGRQIADQAIAEPDIQCQPWRGDFAVIGGHFASRPLNNGAWSPGGDYLPMRDRLIMSKPVNSQS